MLDFRYNEQPHFLMFLTTIVKNIMWNEKLWRYHFENQNPLISTYSIRDDELDWKCLSFTKNALDVVKFYHLEKRLKEPPSSKNYLAFFMTIETSGPSIQTKQEILCGKIEQSEVTKHVQILFRHKTQSSILFWNGEADIRTKTIGM